MLDILPYLKVYTFIRTSYIPTGKKVSSETVNQHWHSYCQLVYVRRGTGSVIIDGSFFPVSEGDVVIIRRNEHTTDRTLRECVEVAAVEEVDAFIAPSSRVQKRRRGWG